MEKLGGSFHTTLQDTAQVPYFTLTTLLNMSRWGTSADTIAKISLPSSSRILGSTSNTISRIDWICNSSLYKAGSLGVDCSSSGGTTPDGVLQTENGNFLTLENGNFLAFE